MDGSRNFRFAVAGCSGGDRFWIVGPSRGMYVTAQKNLLPAAFAKMNKNGVPVTLVISQLVITTIALIILTNTGGGNNMSFLIAPR